MSEEKPTKDQLEQYLAAQRLRLASTASAWMKAEVRKGIALAESELAKLK